MSKPVPSPCIDVCKFKRAGHCIGCGMSKKQKKTFKKIDGDKKRLKFIRSLVEQQSDLGGYPMWPRAYRKVCRKKSVHCPLDDGRV